MGSEPTNSVTAPMDAPEGFPISAHAVDMKSSAKLNDKSTIVSGYDFNEGIDHEKLLLSMLTTGFQASHLGQAIVLINNMLDWRPSDEPIEEGCSEEERFARHYSVLGGASHEKCVQVDVLVTMARGVEEDLIKCLAPTYTEKCVQVDVLVTTAGGVEEDLIKCLAPTYTGDFSLPGAQLRSNGLN